ncbi:MAG: hypothetical protein UE295_06545 [Acutalibacteraceae bacterium]|nr:hypothetical protein [Acutalibacteraceae bacterium]
MRTAEQIKQDLKSLENWKRTEEIADNFFYTNGKESYYSKRKLQLLKELEELENASK